MSDDGSTPEARVHPLLPLALPLETATCCCCQVDDAEPVGVGEDFEYRTSPDSFLVVRCRRCQLLYLNPRPAPSAFPQIYPDTYHAFAFEEEKFGIIHRIRRKLESKRIVKFARGLPNDLKILDVGCGDGFHLKLIHDFAPKTWKGEGIDADSRAVAAAHAKGLNVTHGQLEQMQLQADQYDLVLMIMTIEHLNDPMKTLKEVHRLLKPNGRLVIVTDNASSPDFYFFQERHWGGYHFPRHTYLFDPKTLSHTLTLAGFKVESVKTAMSPVNWVYSIRNWLDDWGAPRWLVRQLSLQSPIPLTVGTLFDIGWTLLGRGAILHGSFRKSSS